MRVNENNKQRSYHSWSMIPSFLAIFLSSASCLSFKDLSFFIRFCSFFKRFSSRNRSRSEAVSWDESKSKFWTDETIGNVRNQCA